MKTWKWILLGIVIIILVGAIFFYNNKEVNLADRENVLEYKDIKNYIVYIEAINIGETEVKLYNKNTKLEEPIEGFRGNFYNLKVAPDESFFIVDEGLEKVKTTYIVPIGDMEKSISLKTIGNVVISPDSNKLLIGVENFKERADESQLKGTIDLVIYYLNTGSIEILLEADEYTDYEGISWDNEDNIKYRKVSQGVVQELSIKYEAPVEELLMEAIYSNDNVDISQVLKYMGKLNFNKLEDLYGENSTIELLEWLSGQNISNKEDILILINLMDSFFGKEYFLYIRSLANAYIDYKMEFVKALAQVPEMLEDIAYALNYMGVYNIEGQDMWRDLDKIANSEELSENERKIGMELIHFYSQCST